MSSQNNVIHQSAFLNRKRHQDRQQEIIAFENEIPSAYQSDIRAYQKYLVTTDQTTSKESMYDFLDYCIKEQRIKSSTFEKRICALKRYIIVETQNVFQNDDDFKREMKYLRSLFKQEEYSKQTIRKGKKALPMDELMKKINKLSIRAKAICLVNLITGNRPSEMVRIQIKDFDLEDLSVNVYLKKQKIYEEKRLTLDTVMAIQEYIKKYNLQPKDYLIGSILSNGNHEKYISREISTRAYLNDLKKWTGFTAYNFRKTLVSDMHERGADLATIAKQTGHKSIKTINDHYLKVSNRTVDKFLP